MSPVAEALVITSANFVVAWTINVLIHSSVLFAAIQWISQRQLLTAGARAEMWRAVIIAPPVTAGIPLVTFPRWTQASFDIVPIEPWLGTRPGVAVVLLAASLLVAASLPIALVTCVSAARRLLAGRVKAEQQDMNRLLEVSLLGKFPPARLSMSKQLSAPAAVGHGEICLPLGWNTELNPMEQSALIAHEMAHLHRRDPIWLTVACVCARTLWFQPLNRIALRKLREASEEAADALAVERLGNPRALASALAKLAPRVKQMATVIPANGGAVLRRVQLLREGVAAKSAHSHRIPFFGLVVALSLACGVDVSVESAANAIPWLAPSREEPNARMLEVRKFEREVRRVVRGH